MKNRLWAIALATLVAFVAYVFVSAAARNCAIDEVKLHQWRMETAIRRSH